MRKILVSLATCLLSLPSVAAQNHGLHIGIVGGGPSGLSAAYRLHKAGFANVTVLERAADVGGKTDTVVYQGHTYEMGAIMSGPSYDEVNELAKEVGEPIVKFSPGGAAVVEAEPVADSMQTMPVLEKLRFLAAAAEYQLLYHRYQRYFDQPGMAQVPAELDAPFSIWIKKNAHFHAEIEELLSHSFVSFGYGYMSEVPAAYVMRYFSPRLLRSFMFGQVRMLQNGYQNLWRKVAEQLDVETGFEVKDAHREGSTWSVTSTAGQIKNFDVIIWTAPLDATFTTTDLPAQLKTVFSKIQYQFYSSTLVETDGLAKGSGVVTKNYQAGQSGNIVSWLYRWPNQTNVANFYTLSDSFMTADQVETGIQAFAHSHGFKIKRVIQNANWRYFPHFDQAELDARAYPLIESEQGRNGFYFAGEIMNFSTVEHSAEYSHELVQKYFINEAAVSTILPAAYRTAGSEAKLQELWHKILASEYGKRPTYKEVAGSTLKEMRGFLPAQLSKAFNNNTDIIEKGRTKIIHKLGSTALVRFETNDPGYNQFDALIRLSNAVDGSTGLVYPSFSIKIPMSGDESSVNFNIGKSFDGQHIGNDFKGPADYNFFRDDKTYPFSNELPLIPHSSVGKAFKWVFDRAHWSPNYIPVDELTKVMNKQAPRRFVFHAPPAIRDLMTSKTYTDERAVFATIPAGSVLFHVYESSGLNDPGHWVGDLRTTTRFVASSFGDQNLYFEHESRGLKKPQPEFSVAK